MGNLGFGELLLIVVVLALIFGTSRLPALGDAIGRALRGGGARSGGGADAPAPGRREGEGRSGP